MSPNDFFKNKNFFKLIAFYIVGLVAVCALIIKAIVYWTDTKSFLSAIMSLLAPFFAGIFIAYIIHPLVKRFEKNLFYDKMRIKSHKLRQFLAIFISYIIVFGLTTVFLVVVIPQIGDSLYEVLGLLQSLYKVVSAFLSDLEIHYPNFDFEFLDQALSQVLPSIVNYLSTLITDTIPKLYSASVLIVTWIFNFVIAVTVSCYVLSDRRMLRTQFKKLFFAIFSEKRANSLITTLKNCNEIFGGFIVGKFIDSLIIGLLCSLLLIIFKIPFVALISLIIGVTNMIPYFGPIIGAIPGILIIILVDPGKALVYLIIVIALQQFDGNILGPKIIGDSTGLRPLWVIFAITVGGWLWGPLGMFFGVPLFAVISYLSNNWVEKRLSKKNIEIADTPAPVPPPKERTKKEK